MRGTPSARRRASSATSISGTSMAPEAIRSGVTDGQPDRPGRRSPGARRPAGRPARRRRPPPRAERRARRRAAGAVGHRGVDRPLPRAERRRQRHGGGRPPGRVHPLTAAVHHRHRHRGLGVPDQRAHGGRHGRGRRRTRSHAATSTTRASVASRAVTIPPSGPAPGARSGTTRRPAADSAAASPPTASDRVGPRSAQGPRHPDGHGLAGDRQQGLVGTHPPAGPAAQHRAGERHGRADH